MASPILQHSDQLVATIAKLPVTTFGSPRIKEVALVLANSLNKAQGWSIVMRVKTIAVKACCSPRTVQRALKCLESLELFQVVRRKHATIEDFNFASVYKLGPALRSLFNQLVTTPSHGDRGKSSTSFKQKQSNKDRAPSSSSVGKFAMFDQKRAAMTQEDWEASKKASQENNRNALAKLKSLFGRGQQ